jgi:mono/diheme cytochrome c family protein
MTEEQKRLIREKYQEAKQWGEKFFPDTIYKDLLVSFALFLLLVGLAAFVGVAAEPKADPSDTSYVPRPEWYFLFLFELLKFFPGSLEWVGTAVIPGLAVTVLFVLPFLDRNPSRHWRRRKLAIGIMSVVVVGMVALTIRAVATTPPQAEGAAVAATLPEQIAAGGDLYAVQCVECHGPDGEGGRIEGVKGLEGVTLKSIRSQDEMYTRSDDTLFAVINYGQQDLGMPPFGKQYGGELGPGEIESIVAFMRYTWDDRMELPKEAAQASTIPALKPDETPAYEAHVAPIVKRYCVSCHRAGKENNNYLMTTYDEVMNTGDHKPNVKPGDLSSNLIRMLHREEIEAGGPMPPTKALKAEFIDIFERWVKAGAPQTGK